MAAESNALANLMGDAVAETVGMSIDEGALHPILKYGARDSVIAASTPGVQPAAHEHRKEPVKAQAAPHTVDVILDIDGLDGGLACDAMAAAAPGLLSSTSTDDEAQEDVDEFADEEPDLAIGSAAVGGGDDDEFDVDYNGSGDQTYAQNSSHLAAPALMTVKAGDGSTSTAAAARAAAAAERDRQAMAAAVAESEAKVRETAATAAAEAEARVEAEARARQEDMRTALASVSRDTRVSALPKPEAKSLAEQADDKAAAVLGRLDDAVIEEEDEDEDEEGEGNGQGHDAGVAEMPSAGSVAQPPPKPTGAELMSAMLMAQFDAATVAADNSMLAQAGAAGAADPRFVKVLYPEAARLLLEESDLSDQLGRIVREDWSNAPLLQRMIPALRPRFKTAELRRQRDRVMGLARLAMDSSAMHERVLASCYRALTKEERAPPRYGNHWDAVGFQGTDPATDLRGAGMLAPLQLLHFAKRLPPLLAAIFAESRREGHDFPFMVVSINMTQIALDALRAGSLTAHANKLNSVYEAVHRCDRTGVTGRVSRAPSGLSWSVSRAGSPTVRPGTYASPFRPACQPAPAIGRDVCGRYVHPSAQRGECIREAQTGILARDTSCPADIARPSALSFYEACFLHLYTLWRRHGATIHRFGELKQETQRAAAKKPAQLFVTLERWRQVAVLDQGDFVDFLAV
eukprot:scaffold3092_cov121-Isochrysis_galbana.AAC.3